MPLLLQHFADVWLFPGMSEAFHKVEFVQHAAKGVFIEQLLVDTGRNLLNWRNLKILVGNFGIYLYLHKVLFMSESVINTSLSLIQ